MSEDTDYASDVEGGLVGFGKRLARKVSSRDQPQSFLKGAVLTTLCCCVIEPIKIIATFCSTCMCLGLGIVVLLLILAFVILNYHEHQLIKDDLDYIKCQNDNITTLLMQGFGIA